MTSTLFVGDLASCCTIDDLEKVFSNFGEIVDIRIAADPVSGQSLLYGFVEFLKSDCAEKAILNVHGKILNGRSLRVSKATTAKSSKTQRSNLSRPSVEKVACSSVHVEFTVSKAYDIVSEDDLHNLFSTFGYVVDVAIIRQALCTKEEQHSGYGFIHFSDDPSGIHCAINAVNALACATVDGVSYICSHRRLSPRRRSENMPNLLISSVSHDSYHTLASFSYDSQDSTQSCSVQSNPDFNFNNRSNGSINATMQLQSQISPVGYALSVPFQQQQTLSPYLLQPQQQQYLSPVEDSSTGYVQYLYPAMAQTQHGAYQQASTHAQYAAPQSASAVMYQNSYPPHGSTQVHMQQQQVQYQQQQQMQFVEYQMQQEQLVQQQMMYHHQVQVQQQQQHAQMMYAMPAPASSSSHYTVTPPGSPPPAVHQQQQQQVVDYPVYPHANRYYRG